MLGSLLTDASTRTLIPALAYSFNRCSATDGPVLHHFLQTMNAGSSASEDAAFSSMLFFNLITYSEMWESPQPSEAVMFERFTNYTITSSGAFAKAAQYCAFSKEDSPVCNELGVANYSASSITYLRDKYFNVLATIPTQASVLLFSSKLDAQTPHKYAKYLYEAPKGTAKVLITFDYATHGALYKSYLSDNSSRTCGVELLASYVSNSSDLSKLNRSCVDAIPPISFEFPTDIFHWYFKYLSTDDAYEGSYDALLSSTANDANTEAGSSTTTSGGSESSYKLAMVVFASLFAGALAACAAFAYRVYKSKRTQSDNGVSLTTP